jgi:Tol biopolymer transport system component
MLLPERGDASVELTELSGEDDVVSLGQTVQEIGALLACTLGLGADFGKCSHHMGKRKPRIRHSLALSLLALAGCMGGDEERWEVAYSAIREEVPTRIVVVQDDGKKSRRVSGAKFRANPVLPQWSPDGRRIAFVRANPAGGPRAFRVYVVNADGSGERLVGEGTLPVWTNDGRSLVVERLAAPGQNSTIYVYSADGRTKRRLASGSGPAISHRGSRVAFVRFTYRKRPNGDWIPTSSSLYTISLDGTGLRLLGRTNVRNRRWVQPAWVPGDAAVSVVQRTSAIVGSGPLLTFSLSGRRRSIVPRVGETYAWSPRGDFVAYTLGEIIYIVRPDGTEVDAYGESAAIDIGWSPDGKLVGYSVQEVLETGQLVGLYIIDLEKKERRRFAVADGFAAFFDWRPKPPD